MQHYQFPPFRRDSGKPDVSEIDCASSYHFTSDEASLLLILTSSEDQVLLLWEVMCSLSGEY